MVNQNKQSETWWQRNKRTSINIAIIIIVLFLLFALAVHFWGWDWSGFTNVSGPTLQPNEQYRPAKTLWDVLQLLIVPIILAIGGFWLNQIQKDRDKKAEETQKQREENAAKEREKIERESREDNQREIALQNYIDKIIDLMLKEHLRELPPEHEVRKIARVRTLNILPRLDGKRKRSVLQFLHESGLLEKGNRKIDLHNADLTEADLQGMDLVGTSLHGINFHRADFQGAYLTGATLWNADLSKTNLKEANLWGAELDDANLTDASITQQQWEKVASLKGTTMPDGTKHP